MYSDVEVRIPCSQAEPLAPDLTLPPPPTLPPPLPPPIQGDPQQDHNRVARRLDLTLLPTPPTPPKPPPPPTLGDPLQDHILVERRPGLTQADTTSPTSRSLPTLLRNLRLRSSCSIQLKVT